MKHLSPRQAVRAHCVECLCLIRWDSSEIENCKGDTCKTGLCPFYPFRLGKRIPVKAFRFFCIHCMGGQTGFIIDCPSTACKVYPYRMGNNPSRQGIGNYGARIGREFVKTDQELMI
jgi:hypothetical protein